MVGSRFLLAVSFVLFNGAPAVHNSAGRFRGGDAQTVRNANANSNSNTNAGKQGASGTNSKAVSTKNGVVISSENAEQSAANENLDMMKNPVRKVVTLLQNLAKKIEKEAEQEKELYEKFMCYCKNAGGELATSIADSTAKVPQVQSDIESSEAQVVQYKADLKKHQSDRSDVQRAMAEATSLREKEHAAFAKENAETVSYVTALDKAIPAVQNGMSGSALLQSSSAVAELQRAAASDVIDVTDDDREAVTAFLSGTVATSYGYIPKGGEILGILKTMREDFAKSAKKLQDDEAQAVKTYDELIAAKTKEEKSLTASIQKKTERVGELAVAIVSMKDELTDTEAALIEDQKLQASLATDCDSKQKEFEQRVATRGEELAAVSDTIKILNDDDALELFKKTLPGAGAAGALMQVKSGKQQMRQRAMSFLHKVGAAAQDALNSPDVRFIELALVGGKVDFSKVIKMIDDMVAILAEEQMDDDHKKEYCDHQLDFIDDKLKTLQGTESDLETAIEDGKTTFAQLEEDIKGLAKGVKELDESILEATEQRKEENEEYTELMSSNTAAKELLEFAKNRLNKFYNPKLYKAPPKRELSEEDRISVNMGGTMAPTEAPGGIAGTGIGLIEPAPETWEKGYKKKSEESNGVMAMIDLLVRDLDKEMTEAETQERNSQAAYEGLMHDSAVKRSKDTKLISEKEATKADTEEALVKSDGELISTQKELMATKQYEGQLHGECDWLLKYFDLRKTARAEESDNLKKAKATLLGADFSLLQQQSPSVGFLADVKQA